jgi:hypothetical protein
MSCSFTIRSGGAAEASNSLYNHYEYYTAFPKKDHTVVYVMKPSYPNTQESVHSEPRATTFIHT